MWKTASAIAAAALLAAAISLLPGFNPEVAASVPAAAKSDRAGAPADCAHHGWPYYDTACLHDGARKAGRPRPVRIVTTDRLAFDDPRAGITLAPLWTSVEALQTAVPAWARAMATDGTLTRAAPVRLTLALSAQ